MKAQTIDRLYEMNLTGMAKSFEKRHQQPDHQDLSFDDFFSLLVEDEYVYRLNNRQKRLLQQAKFKYPYLFGPVITKDDISSKHDS